MELPRTLPASLRERRDNSFVESFIESEFPTSAVSEGDSLKLFTYKRLTEEFKTFRNRN
jgi:hypothetical protein